MPSPDIGLETLAFGFGVNLYSRAGSEFASFSEALLANLSGKCTNLWGVAVECQERQVLEAGMPNIRGLLAKVLHKRAGDLIRGRLKRSQSYHTGLEEKTVEQLIKTVESRGPDAHKASQMLKLIKESPRVMDKVDGKFR